MLSLHRDEQPPEDGQDHQEGQRHDDRDVIGKRPARDTHCPN
ncbi:hypothetical protein [Streptomyces cyaneofuscatus]